MKTKNFVLVASILSLLIMSCENPIRMETKVHEDGSLDKTIEFDKADSLVQFQNYFGVSQSKGWVMTSEKIESNDNKKKFKITFTKSFQSADFINKELGLRSDTLFAVHSNFEKRFRWFYTYIRYSEILSPIDRFKMVDANDYFNQEDRSFINRLPGEETAISKADSLFLKQLNEKIYDQYAKMGMFNEQFAILKEVVKRNAPDKKWSDTLNMYRELIYDKLDEMNDDPALVYIKLADSLHIPIEKERAIKDFTTLSKDLASRFGFMAFARDGKYMNAIEMPWTIMNSNADSIAGNTSYWNPLPTKFAIQEYEMFAESRRLNWWAVGVSIAILGLTVFMFVKRK